MNATVKPSDFLPLTAARRRRIESTIEALLQLLDTDDGEQDLESTGDEEPYLAGWSGTNEDLEDENEHGTEDGEYDSSLAYMGR
ncbi:hypothetical protein [Mesorhizobium sp.]|uniref:hypothetical protein n=1 Tax=Mesorhizobium sp. TaxID=1871066 RepID=UPI000FE7AD93|nr:hypothetical protein [Mesorhizobium sp.]RWF68770.1 MAG: hypothetical protein EOQ34_24310 [Mesorhizobium sp.]TIN03893.1 MAG: hypothetical protein E5Y38_06440 [Mesorhizobium sp.]TIQ95474.1 MAG: hypothetical protein E5X36_21745 [Mesorhizobium sp.]